MQAIPSMVKKRNTLAVAPTGSGKTLAFIVPLIAALGKPQAKGFRAVIVAPTRELAQQVVLLWHYHLFDSALDQARVR